MSFSDKQKALIKKAVENGYLSHMLPAEAIETLSTFEPKSYILASEVIGLVMDVAYGRGDETKDIWNPEKRRPVQQKCAEKLIQLLK